MPKSDYQHYKPSRFALHERAFPHRVLEGVWMWSFYQEETALHGNGYLVKTTEGQAVIIDPPSEGAEVLESFTPLPMPTDILLTNADHERAADSFRRYFNCPVHIHELDAARLSVAPDRTFRDGAVLPGDWQAIHLGSQKTPGDCAFYHADRKMLILGDSLIARKYQHLALLPDSFYADRTAALQGLQRLLGLDVKTILPGHGDPIVSNASALLKDALRPEHQT